MLAGKRVVRDAALGVDIVLGELEQAVELEGRLIVGAVLRLYIVTQKPFIPRAQVMGLIDVGENIAPMVVMLDKVALRETRADALANTSHRHRRNHKEPLRGLLPLHPDGSKGSLVQGV